MIVACAVSIPFLVNRHPHHCTIAVIFSPFRIADRLLGPLAARLRFRAVDVYLERIGEIGQTLDLFVKSGRIGWRPRYRAVVVAPPDRVANAAYLSYWKSYVRIIQRSPVMPLLKRARWSSYIAYRPADIGSGGSAKAHGATYATVQSEWERRGHGPLLTLRPEHRSAGKEALRRLGLPDDSWFAALHARSPGFLSETAESHRWWRNVDVATYEPALRLVVERGGWIIRLGDPTMPKLPPLPQVIDYAHHDLRSDWLDIFLAAEARFMICTTSGMAVVAATFGVPLVATNWVPFSSGVRTSADIYQPKLYRHGNGRMLTFEEALAPPIFDLHDGRVLDRLGIELIENSPGEIAALTREMSDRLDGAPCYASEDEELQARYRRLFKAHGIELIGRVGRDFLRQHAHLLPS
jgi:putative glycosyltransferase (TIGR04372 family)